MQQIVSVQAHVCNVERITGNLLFKIGEMWVRIVKKEDLETERVKRGWERRKFSFYMEEENTINII
jgi:hypothetical protein